jgi:hypothetical protein
MVSANVVTFLEQAKSVPTEPKALGDLFGNLDNVRFAEKHKAIVEFIQTRKESLDDLMSCLISMASDALSMEPSRLQPLALSLYEIVSCKPSLNTHILNLFQESLGPRKQPLHSSLFTLLAKCITICPATSDEQLFNVIEQFGIAQGKKFVALCVQYRRVHTLEMVFKKSVNFDDKFKHRFFHACSREFVSEHIESLSNSEQVKWPLVWKFHPEAILALAESRLTREKKHKEKTWKFILGTASSQTSHHHKQHWLTLVDLFLKYPPTKLRNSVDLTEYDKLKLKAENLEILSSVAYEFRLAVSKNLNHADILKLLCSQPLDNLFLWDTVCELLITDLLEWSEIKSEKISKPLMHYLSDKVETFANTSRLQFDVRDDSKAVNRQILFSSFLLKPLQLGGLSWDVINFRLIPEYKRIISQDLEKLKAFGAGAVYALGAANNQTFLTNILLTLENLGETLKQKINGCSTKILKRRLKTSKIDLVLESKPFSYFAGCVEDVLELYSLILGTVSGMLDLVEKHELNVIHSTLIRIICSIQVFQNHVNAHFVKTFGKDFDMNYSSVPEGVHSDCVSRIRQKNQEVNARIFDWINSWSNDYFEALLHSSVAGLYVSAHDTFYLNLYSESSKLILDWIRLSNVSLSFSWISKIVTFVRTLNGLKCDSKNHITLIQKPMLLFAKISLRRTHSCSIEVFECNEMLFAFLNRIVSDDIQTWSASQVTQYLRDLSGELKFPILEYSLGANQILSENVF